MSNTSLFRIADFHTPIAFRNTIRSRSFIALIVTYFQYLLLKLELYIEDTLLRASVTPQVCYLERLLRQKVSLEALINPQPTEVILWKENEEGGVDVIIDDTIGVIFHHEDEFNLGEFIVLLPKSVAVLVPLAHELLSKYKLPGKQYTIILR